MEREIRMKDTLEDVTCAKCGTVRKVQAGMLTEQGKREYLCPVCREPVVERQIEQKRIGDKKLLLD
jgi:hypothetical protein